MTSQLVLIDDDARAREALRRSLHALGNGDFDVHAYAPPSNLDLTEVLHTDVDLFLVDYQLDTYQPDGSIPTYRGSTLSARIREERQEVPIVLLTRSGLDQWTSNERTIKASRNFDSVLYKEENLRDEPETTHIHLLSLIRGYRILRECDRTIIALLELLKTDSVGQDAARAAVPPGNNWKAIEAGYWIRGVLLHFPGVVYNSVFAATALGVSIDSFNQPAMLQLLDPARYRGPFGEPGYWWRHTLFDIANQLRTESDEALGLREAFLSAACDRLRIDIKPSTDIETGFGLADTVCYLENAPTRIETSLPYHPDARPSVMDEARVSFKAIRERNDVVESYLDEAGRLILEELRQVHQ